MPLSQIAAPERSRNDPDADARLEQHLLTVLSQIQDATRGLDVVTDGQVYAVVATGGAVRVLLDPERFPSEAAQSALAETIQTLLADESGVERLVVKPRPRSICLRSELPGVRRVIGVHSGKGGVGKSTVAVNLALALAARGLQVGLLDADVHGPSAPTLLGLSGRMETTPDGMRVRPLERHGLKVVSLGFLLPETKALIWRGPLVERGLAQLFTEVDWGELDLLLVDLPPGTSDVHLEVARQAPLAGILTVTAPGQVAVDDVRRGMEMFADLTVPCLGIVENFAGLVCGRCGTESALFGAGGGAELATLTGLPLLARLPFDAALAEASDAGRPPLVASPETAASAWFQALAGRVAGRLGLDQADQPEGYAMRARRTVSAEAVPVQSPEETGPMDCRADTMRRTEPPIPIPVRSGTSQAPINPEPDTAPGYAEPGEPIPGVRDVVLVAGGKGGVGKSTVTVNLACALRVQGLRVGVLDADLYGPSIARMLGTDTELEQDAAGRAIPAVGHGVHSLSIAQRIPPEAALVWKGPLVTQTLMDMVYGVAWPDLDVLLVDLPPGTGDVQLSLLERLPVSGAVLVTTPQRLAQVDAERGIALFHELDIPVLGVIENMSHPVCPSCGEPMPLFPDADVRALARRRHVPYLGRLPLDPAGQVLADTGRPLVEALPESAAARTFQEFAHQLRAALEREAEAALRNADPNTRAAHAAFWERLIED
ncbi:Mrp/NBP35 family ATP-binding protein [Allochromatium tepidum]|uniref:Iron-sulfur cluster carrier protein n=1 Tax=Allochromatium tepidum TaxID=553982 RepID=A0ABM7QL41_9GAMM|nr:Mrp/NBP35 family ATP-binding protein [Allochromatium tepidum]BCU06451.1 hypothetical protein Atep_11280 [Allochromatium tepidum]